MMQGFDPEWEDLPGYILGITERIWEGREIGGIRRWYADDIVLRAPTGISHVNEPVVAATLATLHEFPDRRLPGEDVIWCGDEADGFLSSHRLISWMTHAQDGAYGPATGRFVRYRIIADCFVRANQVREEWLARDQAAIARELGYGVREMAALQIGMGARGFYTPDQDVVSAYQGRIETSGPAGELAAAQRAVWAGGDVSAVRRLYQPAASLHGPGNETHVGHAAIERFLVSYLAAFPGARFDIHHAFARCDPGRPVRIAIRWSLDGQHTGFGRFGAPSGAAVHVMGFTHAELVDDRIMTEWTITDEVAIWKQILEHATIDIGAAA